MNGRPILLVDDTAAHRAILRRALGRAGLTAPIIEAGGLAEALQLISDHPVGSPPPLMSIVDLNLGDGRGSTLITALRQDPVFQPVPVLAISTSELESDVRECYAAGADTFVAKSDDVTDFARDVGMAVAYLLLFAE